MIGIDDTIVACSTPPGIGAISCIRVSGPSSANIFKKITNKKFLHLCVSVSTIQLEEDIDEKCVLTSYRKPNSYTGEDSFEISCHGNPLIVDLLIKKIKEMGCRSAEPGEFTMRSFLNNKIGLIEAEAVSDLIHAESIRKLKAVGKSLKGEFSKKVDEIILELREIRAKVESEIDFNDQDIKLDKKELVRSLDDFKIKLEGFVSITQDAVYFNEGIKTVITGPPNAGKSSLMNYLTKNDTSIVSEKSGTTRDLVTKSVKIGQFLFKFYDTAGILKNTEDLIELEGISKAERALLNCDLVIEMVDNSQLDYKKDYPGKKSLRIINKTDLSDESTEADIRISLKTGKNTEILNETLIKAAFSSKNPSIDGFSARTRHLMLLKECLESLCETKELNLDDSLELIAEHLRVCSDILGQIKDPYSSDDLLGNIFSTFCIGK